VNDGAARGPVDILVKLYELPPLDPWRTEAAGVIVRRAIAPEKHLVTAWVRDRFEAAWASEAEVAFASHPVSCLIAVRGQELLGFACYDATALGVFGPTGVVEAARGLGIGAALFLASLHAMRERGYAYAVVGAAGPVEFYRRLVDGMLIPGSWPGLYRGMLREEGDHEHGDEAGPAPAGEA
jgi:GNAT superfamily N-acetyltransferase